MVMVVVFEFCVMRCQPLRRALCISIASCTRGYRRIKANQLQGIYPTVAVSEHYGFYLIY